MHITGENIEILNKESDVKEVVPIIDDSDV